MRYYSTGEVNFEVDDKEGAMKDLSRKYSQGQSDDLDGVTVQFKDWWFNVRPSNTEPLLRLIVEANDARLLREEFHSICDLLGDPVEH